MEQEIEKYISRINRNKLRIFHHKCYIAITTVLFLLMGIMIFQNKIQLNSSLFIILYVSFVFVDILFISYHQLWINKWKKTLTELTGKDYLNIDSIENVCIKKSEFKKFANKYMSKETIELFLIDNPNFINKIYRLSANKVLKTYCEKNCIANTYKIEEMPFLEEIKKELKTNQKSVAK